jgi:hypothetical protein
MTQPTGSTDFPDWAVEKTRAALKVGMKVPDVEKLLVARGLDSATANGVVMSFVEGKVRDEVALEPGDDRSPLQLILSGIVVIACLLIVYWKGGGGPTAWTLVCILPGLAAIWLPAMMDYPWGSGSRVVGWIWLILFGVGRVILVWIFNP